MLLRRTNTISHSHHLPCLGCKHRATQSLPQPPYYACEHPFKWCAARLAVNSHPPRLPTSEVWLAVRPTSRCWAKLARAAPNGSTGGKPSASAAAQRAANGSSSTKLQPSPLNSTKHQAHSGLQDDMLFEVDGYHAAKYESIERSVSISTTLTYTSQVVSRHCPATHYQR